MPTRPSVRVVLLLAIAAACGGTRGNGKRETAKPSPALAIACPTGTTFAGEGPPAGRSAWCVDADGRQHGPAREWFDDGTVRTEGAYVHGAMDGQWRSYYAATHAADAGKVVRSEKSYRAGAPTGTWTTYFADGEPSTVLVHEGGDRARLTEYGPGRQKLREGGLLAGARHGAWIEWDPYGNEVRSEWDAGKPKATTSTAQRIGIPECDEYIEKYRRCIETHVPEAARQSVRDAVDATLKAWREAAAGPAREGLATSCKVARDAAKQATTAMGCVW
jgi:hypothetical protein